MPASPIGTPAIRARAERMLRVLKRERSELSLLLCDDSTIQALNRSHRKKNKPTDVLAFALQEGPAMSGAEGLLGDVVISLDTARRQAAEHRRTLWDEVTMLLAHGLLHLLGFDHRTDAEERRMNARADVLIAAANARETRPRRSPPQKKAVRKTAKPPSKTAKPPSKAAKRGRTR